MGYIYIYIYIKFQFNQYPTAKSMKQVERKGKRVKIPVDLSTKKSESLGAEEREPPERASLVDFS